MGTTLTGLTPATTYDALLKTTDNQPLTTSLKVITDGLGNDSALSLATTSASITGTLAVSSTLTASNLSGTNTGDETQATIKSKLGAATTSVDGYLTSTDWTTFNNKVATTRSISTSAPLSGGGDLSANRTLSISQATTSTDGYLSSTDWNTFNGKQNTLTNPVTGTTNYVPKLTGASTIGNSQIFDNGTNIGIGTASPTLVNFGLEFVVSRITGAQQEAQVVIQGNTTTDSNVGGLHFYNNTNFLANISGAREGANNSGIIKFSTNNAGSSAERMRITSNGNVGIGTQTVLNNIGNGTLQLGTTMNLINIGNQAYLQNNWNYVGGGTPTHIINGVSSRFLLNTTGDFIFTNTSSGSANTTIVSEFERMRITSGGNVGIGTPTPTSIGAYRSLTLNGIDGSIIDLRFNSSENGRIYSSSDTAVGLESLSTTLPLIFKTQNGSGSLERMRIVPNGNIIFKGQSTAILGEALFQNNDSALSFYSTQSSVLASKEIRFFTKVATAEQRMTILANGNILIGTLADNGAKLQVNGGITVAGTSALADNQLRIRGIGDPNHAIVNNDTINGPLSYGYFGSGLGWTEGGSAQIALMNVRGNVLIGSTTDTGQRLQVNGETTLGGRTGIRTAPVSGSALTINGENNGSADNGLLIRNSSSTNLFRVRNDGVVDTIGNPVASNLGAISINGTYQTIFTAATDAAYFLTVQTSQSDGTYAIFTLYNENSGERFTSTILGNNIQVQFSGNAVQIRSGNGVSYLTTWSAIRIK